MAIRNAAKAIIIDNGKVLLNKYIGKCNEIYYDLPGGGQNQFEDSLKSNFKELINSENPLYLGTVHVL